MSVVKPYDDAYYSMTWMGPKGYPENGNSGRCYFTGLLGMFRLHGESDVLFADGTSGDGFSFRWTPVWGAPAFNGGAGAFHEIWEYTPRALGYHGHWEQDHEGGFEEAFAKLRRLVDRGVPVQVGLHYSLMLPYGAKTSPRLKFQHDTMGKTGFGHHVVIAGYDLDRGTITIFEPNDVMPHARYEAPIDVFRTAWEQSSQRGPSGYEPWEHHHPFGGEWSLHDGYGPYLMVWVEPERDPDWDIAKSIRHSFRRNLKILSGEYPKPYALFGNQWQIPRFETGAPGHGRVCCADQGRQGQGYLRPERRSDSAVRARQHSKPWRARPCWCGRLSAPRHQGARHTRARDGGNGVGGRAHAGVIGSLQGAALRGGPGQGGCGSRTDRCP